MFDYITKTRQIHNVLWVYSPDQSRSGPSQYYPGDSYVDIVALDAYTNDPVSDPIGEENYVYVYAIRFRCL